MTDLFNRNRITCVGFGILCLSGLGFVHLMISGKYMYEINYPTQSTWESQVSTALLLTIVSALVTIVCAINGCREVNSDNRLVDHDLIGINVIVGGVCA